MKQKRLTLVEKRKRAPKNVVTTPEPESVKEDYFESPESSQVIAASYAPATSTMRIIFRGRPNPEFGSLYEYQDIPQAVWDRFKAASSKGQFVNQEIVGDRANPKYKGVKIG